MMAFWDRFFRRKTVAMQDVFAYLFGGEGRNKLSDSEEAILQSHLIYRAVASIAQRLGSLPYHIMNSKGEINDSAEKTFLNINPDFTFTEILEKTVSFQSLTGYHVWYVENKIITPIDSNLVRIERNSLGQWRVTPLWRYNALPNQDNFVIFPNFTPYNSFLGISELKTCIDVANLGENAITLTNNIMNKGGLIQGILGTDQELTPDQAKQAKEAFDTKYSGISNSGGIGIFGKGLTWQKIGLSPSDFSALDLMKVTLEGISIAFGVPKIFLMNTESVDYANSKTQERIFYQITIKPKADRLADRINRFVLPLMGMKDLEFYFDWNSVEALQPDKLLQAQIDEIYSRIGKTYVNELRDRDGQKPVPWGNSYWGNLSMVQIGEASKTIAEAVSEAVTKQLDEKLKQLDTNREDLVWKRFVARTEPQEKRLLKEIEKFFKKEKSMVLERLQDTKKACISN